MGGLRDRTNSGAKRDLHHFFVEDVVRGMLAAMSSADRSVVEAARVERRLDLVVPAGIRDLQDRVVCAQGDVTDLEELADCTTRCARRSPRDEWYGRAWSWGR